MSDTVCNTVLCQELATLLALRISRDMQARNPATDPRLAIGAEADVKALDLKIADLQAKIDDAKIIHFPHQRRRRA